MRDQKCGTEEDQERMTGDPAFPVQGANHDVAAKTAYGAIGHPGMSYRDWLVGMALNGILAASIEGIRPSDIPSIVRDAYAISDAAIAMRKEAPHAQEEGQ